MNRLAEKSLKTLEYFTVLSQLAGQAASEEGRNRCMELRPAQDLEDAQILLDQTSAAKDMMVRQGSPSLGGIRSVGTILRRA